MRFDTEDTIAAVATPPAGAARGVVRLSGPGTATCLRDCFEPTAGPLLPALTRPAVVPGALRVLQLPTPLPCDLFWWPTARSYTRQPVAEIHMCGSPPLLDAALETVCAAGARLAEPGEFTLRAFLAGRLDLAQAEAVLGVIDATGQRDLEIALAQLAGGISRPVRALREELLELLGQVEAGLDFADEDIALITAAELDRRLDAAERQVRRLTDQMKARATSAASIRAVLVGMPNTGKSSLFNALAARVRALTSAHPGTTRDYLVAPIELNEVACQLVDTAGTGGPRPAGRAAIVAAEMAVRQREQATLTLLCIDSTRLLAAWERDLLEAPGTSGRIVVLTKCDRPAKTDLKLPAVKTSSRTGQGIAELRRRLRAALVERTRSEGVSVGYTTARCRQSLRLAAAAIGRGRALARDRLGDELVAAEIRFALDQLGQVVGQVVTDDLLERIFSRFCIGK
ncbi:MAG: tRNA uridine-5-carboxymethylaminomethyl(34) synthesis GTPase MnmE [Planctomycetia bacterium]|nr:MAG: tRNA uridine-5-carboxymethylaminomethyl(34) synthesis GTPase MnmE [Planctomycetia bacterium]